MCKKVIKVSIVITLLFLSGCGSDLITGLGVGVSGSTAMTEAQRLATERKEVLANEIVSLRSQILDMADGLEGKSLLQDELASKKRQLQIAEKTELMLSKAMEGLARDWRNPQDLSNNIRWGVDALLLVFAGLQTKRLGTKNRGIAKFSAETDATTAKKLYDDVTKYAIKHIG